MISFEPLFNLVKERQISLKTFAEMIGVTEQNIQHLKKTNATKTDTLNKICKALNVCIEEIMIYKFQE